MKRIAILLLAVSAIPAWAQTYSCPAGAVMTCAGSPLPTPTPTPIPPPAATCQYGMMSGDLTWSSFHTTQLWPIPPVTGSGELGRTIAFVADALHFANGVSLQGVDETQPSRAKDYVVSACPHSFVPVNANPLCDQIGAGSVMGPIYLRFGPARPRHWFGQLLPTLDCPLTPGGTYYINFRDNSTAYGSVSSQFVIYNRTD